MKYNAHLNSDIVTVSPRVADISGVFCEDLRYYDTYFVHKTMNKQQRLERFLVDTLHRYISQERKRNVFLLPPPSLLSDEPRIINVIRWRRKYLRIARLLIFRLLYILARMPWIIIKQSSLRSDSADRFPPRVLHYSPYALADELHFLLYCNLAWKITLSFLSARRLSSVNYHPLTFLRFPSREPLHC